MDRNFINESKSFTRQEFHSRLRFAPFGCMLPLKIYFDMQLCIALCIDFCYTYYFTEYTCKHLTGSK